MGRPQNMLILFTIAVVLFGLIWIVSTVVYLGYKLLRKDAGHTGAIAASSFVLCIASFIGFGVTSDAEKSKQHQAVHNATQPDPVSAAAQHQPQKAVDVVQAPAAVSISAPENAFPPPPEPPPESRQLVVTPKPAVKAAASSKPPASRPEMTDTVISAKPADPPAPNPF